MNKFVCGPVELEFSVCIQYSWRVKFPVYVSKIVGGPVAGYFCFGWPSIAGVYLFEVSKVIALLLMFELYFKLWEFKPHSRVYGLARRVQ